MKIEKKSIYKAVVSQATCTSGHIIDRESGEAVSISCGRRTCPKCAQGYVSSRGMAFDEAVNKTHTEEEKTFHIVLTLADKWLEIFPDISDYYVLKARTKGTLREGTTPYDIHMAELRTKFACREISRFISAVRKNKAKRLGYRIKSNRIFTDSGSSLSIVDTVPLIYVKAVEFGERGTKRFHVHLVIHCAFEDLHTRSRSGELDENYHEFKDWNYDEIGESAKGIKSYLWTFGTVRIKGADGGSGGISYLSAYTAKESPGRLTVDKYSRSERKRLLEAWKEDHGYDDEDGDFEYNHIPYKERDHVEMVTKDFLQNYSEYFWKVLKDENRINGKRNSKFVSLDELIRYCEFGGETVGRFIRYTRTLDG